MMGIMRIGRAQLRVMDLDTAVDYYTNVIGLDVVGKEEGKVYLKAWDEWDHHSLILQQADSPGLDHFAFKVEKEDDLSEFEKKVEQFGCTLKRISKGARLGEGEAIRFELPTGHQVELYSEIEQLGTKVGVLNPHPWPDGLRGIAPHRLDHVLLTGEDVKTVTRFFTEALGLYQSEQVLSVDGEDMVGSFMYAANGKPHDVAFIKGPDKKLHHAAFYVEHWYDVLKAADILSKHDVTVEITPTRHAMTRGQTVYFFDPSGNRNEAFASGYITYPDFPTITWTEDKIMHGIFYHRRMLIEESYMKALT
ncbi:catechol 2,3-dioxygenase [Alicyclobacillus acidoterrestris]|uniref:Metapyrocatechase n=1 Tax=Alicyclobacillus acidoterrestris (strain ATCC 49025 / DSM 3922 / CIP 106132 / NCIMB 13137 / GD3B) TaxID=1356854 RepID=A0A9E6ZE45_ALIAG|nr:catechol 2,3-dioxygenase [Alicyclobacillus acidoterrestris]UNO47802.1 catechol 2,3-dioxygenase [Alicyclobacillus acidoterrestris]